MDTNRRSIRIPKFDYSQPGMYFITVSTLHKKAVFGIINHGTTTYTKWGNIVINELNKLPLRVRNIELDENIVMPDHIHMLILIRDLGTAMLQHDQTTTNARRAPTLEKSNEKFGNPVHASIPTIIRSFKSSVTNRIRQIERKQVDVWQKNYYEHIVRDENELYQIRKYIHDNPEASQFS